MLRTNLEGDDETILENIATIVCDKDKNKREIGRGFTLRKHDQTGLKLVMVYKGKEENIRLAIVKVRIGSRWKVVFKIKRPSNRHKYRLINKISGGWETSISDICSKIEVDYVAPPYKPSSPDYLADDYGYSIYDDNRRTDERQPLEYDHMTGHWHLPRRESSILRHMKNHGKGW